MLKPLQVQILLALVSGEKHGYAMMQRIRTQSSGRVVVKTASFYRHLFKLIDDGCIVQAPARPEKHHDPRRGTDYRITSRGRQALAEEKRRLTELVVQMKKIRLPRRKSGA